MSGPSPEFPVALDQRQLHGRYAAQLLRDLGIEVSRAAGTTADDAACAARAWADSGLMSLTGWPQQAPLQGPGALPCCADGALLALQLLADEPLSADLRGAGLLAERAAVLGLSRAGQVSPNGSCHLLRAKDGWMALNLARADDWASLPAWLHSDARLQDWGAVALGVRDRPLAVLLERARWLGLPAAGVTQTPAPPPPWYRVHYRSAVDTTASRQGPLRDWQPLVIDLSSLWAGPLCTQQLAALGARVVKVESRRRPDGARTGSPEFFDLLNAGKASVALDLSTPAGCAQLRQLIARADIVLEGSRPRALRQMGIVAEQLLCEHPQLIWVGITGYGRREPQADWVAFGDDAAVAAGVAAATATVPLFCGDALADPLTGLHAACAALAFWRAGGGVLLDLSLREVTAYALAFAPSLPRARALYRRPGWYLPATGGDRVEYPICLPQRRIAVGRAAELGADTRAVLRELRVSC